MTSHDNSNDKGNNDKYSFVPMRMAGLAKHNSWRRKHDNKNEKANGE